MRQLRVFLHRIAGLVRRDRRDRELTEEIESNLQLHIADNMRTGMSAGEARRQALIVWGGVEWTKDAYRDQRGLPQFDTLLQDIRYALRGLRRSPGFALTAVLTLALGIGATTAIFSAVYALLLRPLPYRDPGRLVWVAEHGAIAAPDMTAWRERGRPFEAVAGYVFNEYTLSGAGDTVRIPGAMVSFDFLSLLGVRPQMGRDFVPADGRPSSPAVALLSDNLWRERFSADPRVVGTALRLDGQPYTVAGVLPPRFRFPDMTNSPQVLIAMYTPSSSAFNTTEPLVFLHVLARLRAGDSLASVRTELQSFQQARLHLYPAPLARMAEGWKLEIDPLQRHLAGDSRKPLIVLLAAVGLVLLIACANIANLQLVRAAARRHEVALRGALGAARTRIARQFLTESMVICALAASGGLAIGSLAIDAIRGWQSPALPWLASVSLDPYVFGFTMGVALLAAVLFGAAPAITGSRANVMDALKTSSPGISGTRDHRVLRNTFVMGEIALALVLLIVAGLLLRSFRGLIRTDPGYDPRNVLTAKVQLPLEEGAGPLGEPNAYQRTLAFAAEALPKLKALPGVKYVALAGRLPLQPNHTATMVWFGSAMPPRETWGNLRVPLIGVTSDFFRAMGTTIVQGRPFTVDDNESSPGVVIVNRAFARQFCPDGALGKRLRSMATERCAGCAPGKPAELEIVGIAADVHQQGLDRPAEPEIYVPFAQAPQSGFHVVLAANDNPGVLAAPLRSTVFALNHQTPVYDVATLKQRLSESLAQRRLTVFLLSTFAVLALMLAAIGVYGVISYAVLQRTQEIGIRMALGATREGVMRLILQQLARIILLGSAAGLVLAVALSGVLSGLLYGVKPRDITAFALSWIMLTAIALLAGVAPTLRAMRADPCVALRYE
jgi:putative ABC transport system permease protein